MEIMGREGKVEKMNEKGKRYDVFKIAEVHGIVVATYP